MSVKKNKNWKQSTPRDQLVAMLQSCQGDLLNMKEGIGYFHKQVRRIQERLDQCQEIIHQMSSTDKWED